MNAKALFLFLFAVVSTKRDQKGKRQICSLQDKTYETIFKLCEGTFDIPVKERTTKMKSACIDTGETGTHSVSRRKTGRVLCCNDKEVLRKGDVNKVVEEEFLHCKGVGVRKLRHHLQTRYEGVSEEQIQKVLSKSKLNQMVNAKFGNKAISRPVRAKAVQVGILYFLLIS